MHGMIRKQIINCASPHTLHQTLKRVLYPSRNIPGAQGAAASVGSPSPAAPLAAPSAPGSPPPNITAMYHLILSTRDKGGIGSGNGNGAVKVWHAAESIQLAGVLDVRRV